MSRAGGGILSLLARAGRAGGGLLPWREYMALALYHEEYGYYARNAPAPGRGGDFSTAPTLGLAGGALPLAVARWAAEMRSLHPGLRRAPFVEIGAGGGEFAAGYLRSLGPVRGLLAPYWIVEVSPPLRERQARALRGRRAKWFSSPREALARSGGRAIFFSNELADAFPCSAWEKTPGGWMEIAVAVDAGGLREGLVEPRQLPPSSVFSRGDFAVGQRVETHEAWREWLATWTGAARHCAMLTADYGAPCARLYAGRPRGTRRAYWRQERIEGGGIYARFGRQDLTADINFTDLERWAVELGWKASPARSLRDFVSAYCPEKFPSPGGGGAAPGAARRADEALEAFCVLEQTIGL